MRLTRRWAKRGGGQVLTAWEAVPPPGFVALGMLCSPTDDAPPVDAIRCVPISWVEESDQPPRKVWDDSGSSGAVGSIWVVNKLQLIAVCAGHDPPAGPGPTGRFYTLKAERLWLGEGAEGVAEEEGGRHT